MDAIQILSNYRVSLAGDRDGLQILAHLLRAGGLTEKEIASRSHLDIHKVILKLNELFRAQLVCVIDRDRWTTTDLAEEVLSRLGISGAVACSVLSDQGIGEIDRSFLEACIEAQSTRNSRWPRYQTTLLRSAEILGKELLRDMTRTKEKRTELSFSIVVGLDSDVQQLGGREYCKSVFDWHKNQESDLWSKYNQFWSENEIHLADRCRDAALDVKESNLLLVVRAPRGMSKKATSRTLRLTLLRLLGAALSNVADSGLSASFRANHDLTEQTWLALEEEYPDLEKSIHQALVALGKAAEGSGSKWKVSIDRQIRELLAPAEAGLGSEEGVGRLGSPEMQTEVRATLGPTRGGWLETTLVRIKSQIDEGHYDQIPLDQQRRIKELILDTYRAVESRSGAADKDLTAGVRREDGD